MRACYHSFVRKAPRLLVVPGVAIGLFALVLAGCESPLETDPYSDITPEQFYQNEDEFIAAVTGVASQLRVFNDAVLNMQEHSSDEMMVPTRGPDWGDGGIWREMTQHTWDATHPFPDQSWEALQVGVARANGVLTTLQASEAIPEAQQAQFAAEVRFLRAYFYYQLMDLFGNVPIVVEEGADTEYTTQDEITPTTPPPQNTRPEMFDFVLSELTGCTAGNFNADCIDSPGGALADLPARADVPYGRATQGAGYALLARVLLNAEVYGGEVTDGGIDTGPPMYAEASDAAGVLIDGDYTLTSDYFENFTADNYNSDEIIFAAVHKADADAGFVRHNAVLHYNHTLPATPWNGFTTIAEFYNSFEEGDDRRDQFLVGPQYAEPSSGCSGAECYSDEDSGPVMIRGSDTQLDFTVEIPSIRLSEGAAVEAAGARPLKWELDPNASGANMGNDFPIFRLAEMYLIRAEAENEVNGPTAAEPDLDVLRARANADPVPTGLSTAEMRALILQERGYEMHNEGVRRQDLIRYEFAHGGIPRGTPYTSEEDPYAPTFTTEWLFKQESEPHRALFPIPENQISVNPELQQNPGY